MATTVRRQYSKSVGLAATQVGGYVAPSVTTGVYITGLVVSNTSPGSINVTVDIFDGTTHVNLCTNTAIPVGGSINIANENNRQVLNAGDKVFVTSSAAASADVNMSLAEIQ